jgi:uncharacterized membrane protein YdcZ (DUF606 family)
MEENLITGIQAIEAILAPALGISATALLLLSLQNRYSLIINRIRLLNEERRRYSHKLVEKSSLDYDENVRHISVLNQIQKMLERCRDVRNAILFIQGSILLFVLTSVFIALNLFISTSWINYLPLLTFVTGMVMVLGGILFSARDVLNSYRITEIEVKADE